MICSCNFWRVSYLQPEKTAFKSGIKTGSKLTGETWGQRSLDHNNLIKMLHNVDRSILSSFFIFGRVRRKAPSNFDHGNEYNYRQIKADTKTSVYFLIPMKNLLCAHILTRTQSFRVFAVLEISRWNHILKQVVLSRFRPDWYVITGWSCSL